MISPYHISKNAIKTYKKKWKELLFFSFSLSLTASLATLLLFIQNNQLWGASSAYSFIFTIAYTVLTFNALFLFINAFKFLLIRKEGTSIKNLFSGFSLKIVFHLILLSIVLLTVFALCYVFPNLILSTIAEMFGPGFFNLLLLVANFIIMAIGLFIIIYLNFAHILIIDENENSFTKIINKSWFLVKGHWWSVFFNRASLVLFNLALSYLSIYLFVRVIPIEWIESLYTQNLIVTPLIITYLLSVLIFSTILSFVNIPYELSFYNLYKELKQKE